MRWLHDRRLRRLLTFYRIEKDPDDVRIERITFGKFGGLLAIYRAITPELLAEGAVAISMFATDRDRKIAEIKERQAEKRADVAEQQYQDLRRTMVDVFRMALLKPNPAEHDMDALAANIEVGMPLYAAILTNSGLKKKR